MAEVTIGYILIGILGFYLIRNIWAGSVLYPVVEYGLRTFNKDGFKILPLRNYYLFVLNPFWWRFVDVFKNKNDRKLIKNAYKAVSEEMKNLK